MEETDNKKLHQFLWESLEAYPDKESIDDEFVLSFEFETGYTYSIKYIDLKKAIENEE